MGLDPQHSPDLATSYDPDHRSIGYVIGTLYPAYLQRACSLQALRTFGLREQEKQAAFASFLSAWRRERGFRRLRLWDELTEKPLRYRSNHPA